MLVSEFIYTDNNETQYLSTDTLQPIMYLE